MKTTQKGSTVTVLLVLIVVIAVLAIGYAYLKPQTSGTRESSLLNTPTQTNVSVSNVPALSASCGLSVSSIQSNTHVTFPLTLTGTVDTRNKQDITCRWSMFEGQAGTAQLVYDSGANGWQKIGAAVPVKVADWTSDLTTFSVTLNFNNGGIGLPKGTRMKVIFTPENASGQTTVRTLEFPVIF